ncbi:hypothetical protein AGDE_11050 [Angomonas deanei]|nr:hypothetical protein AGDE_11050 [Angomonas deanei]|eukprot:EPY26871.1 hypothetical protein AGDE_11050 [Angomonas deanei]
MRATAAEREREVEAAISLRENEINTLEERKKTLQSQLVVSQPSLREDPLLSSFPILDYCGKNAKYPIKSVPLEQVGNVLSQFDIAAKAIALRNKEDRVIVKDLRREIRTQEKKYVTWSEKKRRLADESGIDLKFITPQSREASFNLQNYTSEASIEEIEVRGKIIQKEIRAGKLIVEKKGKTVNELAKLVEERKGLIDEIDELYNQIRVTERDIAVEEEQIQDLVIDQEDVDFYLTEKKNHSESPSRALIEQDVVTLKAEKEDTVNEQRIPQERVVKAQDYRLSQLEARLKAIEKALRHNKLKKEVDNIVSNSWAANTIEVPDSQEELYDIEAIIPAQEQVHPGSLQFTLD